MRNELQWEWSVAPFVRAYLAAARLDRRNTKLVFPSDPDSPMQAVIGHRLMGMLENPPEPLKASRQDIQGALIKGFTQLMTNYAGTDFETTVLVDAANIVFSQAGPVKFSTVAVLVWDNGWFGAFHSTEIHLDDEFFAERALLLTELRHRGEHLEE